MTAPYGPPPHRGEGGWWHWIAVFDHEPGWVFYPDAPPTAAAQTPAAGGAPQLRRPPLWPWALAASAVASAAAITVILVAGR